MSTLYPQVSPEEWSKLHNIPIKTRVCVKCKKTLTLNVPIAFKNYRGFSANDKDHDCGKKYNPFCVVPVGKEEIKIWMNLKEMMTGDL